MFIKSVALQNFRNHARTTLGFCEGTNILVGDNAQGKTNLLEAIYMTCIGRGFKSPRDREVIRFGQQFARVKSVATRKFGDTTVEITIGPAKQILINGIPISKMGELMGTITCVFFNPDELKLVKESPADRRRFMDIDISQIDKAYFYNLLRYNKILKQRNALLKTLKVSQSGEISEDMSRALDIWDGQLAATGEQIINRRIFFCEELKKEVTTIHKILAPNETLAVQYETSAPSFLPALKTSREKDLRLRTTTVGPHRDDILLLINDRDVRAYASQGQQRTVALSLKMAELKIFEQHTGERPIILLDDVLSELDEARQSKLLGLIKGWQSIITATDFLPHDKSIKVFKIANGKVT